MDKKEAWWKHRAFKFTQINIDKTKLNKIKKFL